MVRETSLPNRLPTATDEEEEAAPFLINGTATNVLAPPDAVAGMVTLVHPSCAVPEPLPKSMPKPDVSAACRTQTPPAKNAVSKSAARMKKTPPAKNAVSKWAVPVHQTGKNCVENG